MMRRRPFRDRDVVEVRGTAYTTAHKAQLPAFQSPRPRAVRTSRHRPMDRGDRERADAALTERLARFDHHWTLSAQLSRNGVFVKLFGHQAEDDLTTPPTHI